MVMSNPLEVPPALRDWASHAEDLRAQLQAVYSELQQTGPKNHSIREAVHAELTARVREVIEAAKKEGERVLVAAQQDAQTSLAAARKEAGETSTTTAQGLLEGLSSLLLELTAVRERLEGLVRRLEDAISGQLSDEPMAPVPGSGEAPALPWESQLDADPAAIGAGVSRGSANPHDLESIDQRLIDRLWAEP
jgi:F0F1-type ATP synthase membrane subunit b/b'